MPETGQKQKWRGDKQHTKSDSKCTPQETANNTQNYHIVNNAPFPEKKLPKWALNTIFFWSRPLLLRKLLKFASTYSSSKPSKPKACPSSGERGGEWWLTMPVQNWDPFLYNIILTLSSPANYWLTAPKKPESRKSAHISNFFLRGRAFEIWIFSKKVHFFLLSLTSHVRSRAKTLTSLFFAKRVTIVDTRMPAA